MHLKRERDSRYEISEGHILSLTLHMCLKLPFSLPLKYSKSLTFTQDLPEKSKYQKSDSFPLSLQKPAEGLIRLNYHKTWNEEKTSGTLQPG